MKLLNKTKLKVLSGIRLDILLLISNYGDETACKQLLKDTKMAKNLLSYHIKMLVRYKYLEENKKGKNKFYTIPKSIKPVIGSLLKVYL